MRHALRLAPALMLLGMQVPDDRQRLGDARRAAAAARDRAAQLTAAAAREVDAAAQARAQEQALASRVEAAAATVRVAEAHIALIGMLQERQRARLAAKQASVARLLGALTGLARRPTVAAVAQPGSVDDLVHLRAMLGAALPEMRMRTADVRAELAATRALAARAARAAQTLADGRAALERQRVALAVLSTRHRDQALALTRGATGQSDLALALGERARDLVDRLSEQGAADTTAGRLAALPAPAPRPLAPGVVVPRRAAPVYRLPVRGRLVTGWGEMSPAGVRSRGLSFAVTAGAPVIAPAAGTVRYAARFRGYGVIVLVDHGDGWTSLMTGLAQARVRSGTVVAAGALMGQAQAGDDPLVTVELRRRGRPIDITALL